MPWAEVHRYSILDEWLATRTLRLMECEFRLSSEKSLCRRIKSFHPLRSHEPAAGGY